jgi:hypothetical protein
MLSAVGMFELAATPQRRFKGLTLLVDRDGMEIDVRQSFSVSTFWPCRSEPPKLVDYRHGMSGC